jgi:hypothetical protein
MTIVVASSATLYATKYSFVSSLNLTLRFSSVLV